MMLVYLGTVDEIMANLMVNNYFGNLCNNTSNIPWWGKSAFLVSCDLPEDTQ